MPPSPPRSTSVPSGGHETRPPSLAARARLVVGALLAGLGVGVVGVGVGTVAVGLASAADTGFLLGTLAFGFGLLGWAGSVVAGPGFEAMQSYLDGASGWTEAGSRRAMARIGGFGAGVMLAAVAVGTALGYG
ncbi:DUF7268 family protein [Salinigranum marinum]|uniref:DUF7268 family protein n=1 Tax=Salinigranum marinum TaxID=1515595 RepID=UPI00298A0076|nr:hypothetical protein [Salinigranum marinum]